jgi:hypothetical protein
MTQKIFLHREAVENQKNCRKLKQREPVCPPAKAAKPHKRRMHPIADTSLWLKTLHELVIVRLTSLMRSKEEQDIANKPFRELLHAS